jgi:hypothetical protein
MPITERQLKQWMSNGDPVFGRSDGGGLTFTSSRVSKRPSALLFEVSGLGTRGVIPPAHTAESPRR